MSGADGIGRYSGERLDRLEFNRFHLRILGLIGAGMFLDGFELYLTAAVLGALIRAGWSTMTLNASFVSVTFLGMVIGAFVAGILGDRYGRRFTYQFNLAVFGLASLAAVAAPDMYVLIALRFIMGIGLGAEVVVSYATLTEFVPARIRGRMIGWLAVITNVSLVISILVSLWVIPHYGWRAMFLIVGIGALVVWALRKSMPESPRWLEAQGRFREAEAVLSTIEAAAGATIGGATHRPPSAPAAPVAIAVPQPIWVVFSRGVLGRTLIGILINIVIGFSLYGFISWLPTFLVRQGVSIIASLTWTMVMALGAPVGAVIGLLLSDRSGRKPVIVAGSLFAAACGVVFPHVGNGYGLMAVGFCLFTAIYVLLTVAFALHVPELFPTEYRMRGTAVCSTAGRLTTAGVQYAVVALFAYGGIAGVVETLAGLLVLQAVMVWLFGIETMRVPLEEIGRATETPAASSASVRAV